MAYTIEEYQNLTSNERRSLRREFVLHIVEKPLLEDEFLGVKFDESLREDELDAQVEANLKRLESFVGGGGNFGKMESRMIDIINENMGGKSWVEKTLARKREGDMHRRVQ